MLTENLTEARGVLDAALAGRIVFTPDTAKRRYQLRISIAFDRVLMAVVPELQGRDLQDTVASPTGDVPEWTREIPGELPATSCRPSAA